MWAKEERMERLRGLKILDGNLIPKYKVKRLRIDPVRLSIKVGLKNCPNMRLVAKTLKILTHIAGQLILVRLWLIPHASIYY